MKKYTFMALLVVSSFSVFAQTKETKDDGQELIDRFFDLFKGKGYEYALKYAFETNKWINSEGNEMLNISIKLGKNITALGEYIGFEEIKSKSVGSRFRIVSYFVYYQREPLRFTFELYKNNNGWEIWDFQFDSNYDTELEESMRLSTRVEGFR